MSNPMALACRHTAHGIGFYGASCCTAVHRIEPLIPQGPGGPHWSKCIQSIIGKKIRAAKARTCSLPGEADLVVLERPLVTQQPLDADESAAALVVVTVGPVDLAALCQNWRAKGVPRAYQYARKASRLREWVDG